ncbi:hypothetical protein ACOSP7_024662 [Xanthoceras sorbifolium]
MKSKKKKCHEHRESGLLNKRREDGEQKKEKQEKICHEHTERSMQKKTWEEGERKETCMQKTTWEVREQNEKSLQKKFEIRAAGNDTGVTFNLNIHNNILHLHYHRTK